MPRTLASRAIRRRLRQSVPLVRAMSSALPRIHPRPHMRTAAPCPCPCSRAIFLSALLFCCPPFCPSTIHPRALIEARGPRATGYRGKKSRRFVSLAGHDLRAFRAHDRYATRARWMRDWSVGTGGKKKKERGVGSGKGGKKAPPRGKNGREGAGRRKGWQTEGQTGRQKVKCPRRWS